jgi:hypothetical protein
MHRWGSRATVKLPEPGPHAQGARGHSRQPLDGTGRKCVAAIGSPLAFAWNIGHFGRVRVVQLPYNSARACFQPRSSLIPVAPIPHPLSGQSPPLDPRLGLRGARRLADELDAARSPANLGASGARQLLRQRRICFDLMRKHPSVGVPRQLPVTWEGWVMFGSRGSRPLTLARRGGGPHRPPPLRRTARSPNGEPEKCSRSL